jgi:hypothetical protein
MKTLKHITFILVLLVSFNTYATTACIENTEDIKRELITKMSEDDDVASVFVNLTVLSFIESTKKEFNITGEEFTINYEDVAKGLNADVKNIKAKFPEFYNLSKEDQKDVLNKARLSKKVKDTLVCLAAGTVGLITGCGYQMGSWAFRKYTVCMAAGGLAIVAVEILSDGANSVALEGELSGTNQACLRFALRLTSSEARTAGTCVIGALLAELSTCATIYGLTD